MDLPSGLLGAIRLRRTRSAAIDGGSHRRYPATPPANVARTSAAAGCRGDEPPEQAGVLLGLRVPLHPHPEPPSGVLERLHGAVLGPRRGDQPGMGPDRLVVVAANRVIDPDEAGHDGAGLRADGDVTEPVRAGRVLLVADDVGDVLVEDSSDPGGLELHATADHEGRQVTSRRLVEQRELPGVPVGP